jgi:cytochrome b pre-mRNA-processing protein 3
MLWPFNHFGKPRSRLSNTIEAIYGMIVAKARDPMFYRDLGVPDTVDGRFDLILLHMWMVLRRMRRDEAGPERAQALFDRFCTDMDDNLREMGVGDLTVPKRMQAFGEAFYGRAAAYDQALSEAGEGDQPLAQAICKNILNGKRNDKRNDKGIDKGIDNAQLLAGYVQAALAGLDRLDEAALLAASWTFPSPLPKGPSQ